MENNTIILIKEFVSTLNIEGVCDFWVDYDEEDIFQDTWVYLIFDLDWLEENSTNPEFYVRRIRHGVTEEIKKWFNVDVMVGSSARKCSE